MAQQTLEEAAHKMLIDYGIKSMGQSIRVLEVQKLMVKIAERMYSEEQVIELIQFLSMDKDFNGYGSVSKETAKYFLEKFKK